MEHLCLPSSPVLPPIKVPFLCTEAYDGGPFLDYPERKGWQIIETSAGILEIRKVGRQTSVNEALAFLQTWLFFGLLHEALGRPSQLEDLMHCSRTGDKFLCTANLGVYVERWSLTAISTESEAGVEALKAHLWHLYRCLLRARYVVVRIKIMYIRQLDSGLFEPLTLLAIALLAEYLQWSIRHAFLHLEIDFLPSQIWRGEDVDLGQPVLKLMRENGWCPSDVARLGSSENTSISTLIYYANLPPRHSDKDHSSCTSASCSILQINPSTYQLTHSQPDCQCSLLSVDLTAVGQILRNGYVPLISTSASESSTHATVVVLDSKDNVDFVAISHVWAEGLGNPGANALQSCQISRLLGLANELIIESDGRQVAVWIDSLCVPVAPTELHSLAMLKMREPYQQAKHVLVLDSYLESTEYEGLQPLEIFARVQCCSWMQRLWTLQEGRLSSSVFFKFADQMVSLGELSKNAFSPLFHSPARASHIPETEIVYSFMATNAHEDRFSEDANDMDVLTIRSMLQNRSVSVASDEALCLAGLMDLDLEQILRVPAGDRMRVFWSLVSHVPAGLMYSKAPHKLTHAGFRWAPSSLLGPLPKHHWAGYGIRNERIEGQVTEAGLLVTMPGYVFETNDVRHDDNIPMGDESVWLASDSDGNYYRWLTCEPWSEPAVPLAGSHPIALILPEAMDTPDPASKDYEDAGPFEQHRVRQGLIARVVHHKDETIHVRAHRHVVLIMLGRGYQIYYKVMEELAEQMGYVDTTAPPTFATEELERRAGDLLQASSTAELLVNEARYRGRETSLSAVVTGFCEDLQAHYGRGGFRRIRKTPDDQRWCVG